MLLKSNLIFGRSFRFSKQVFMCTEHLLKHYKEYQKGITLIVLIYCLYYVSYLFTINKDFLHATQILLTLIILHERLKIKCDLTNFQVTGE